MLICEIILKLDFNIECGALILFYCEEGNNSVSSRYNVPSDWNDLGPDHGRFFLISCDFPISALI